MTDRRIKTLALTPRVLQSLGAQIVRYDMINLKELIELIDVLISREELPRDVKVTWIWYDGRMGCFSMLLWSEMFDIVPESEYAPYVNFDE